MVRDGAYSHEKDYVTQVKDILILQGYKNCIIASKVTVILLKRLHWKGFAGSLPSKLVYSICGVFNILIESLVFAWTRKGICNCAMYTVAAAPVADTSPVSRDQSSQSSGWEQRRSQGGAVNNTTQCNTGQCNTVRCKILQCSVVQYSAM